MSSAVDIQIVSPPNLARIESFLNDYTYREQIEFSANFNKRLMIERKTRQPFLDTQTGVAQNNTQLVNKSNRMPGFRQGQLYTYPSARWRKSRRQYLTKTISSSYTRYCDRPVPVAKKELVPDESTVSSDLNGALLEESSSLGGGVGGDTSDSKDSQQQQQQHQLKEDLPKEWFYDEIELNDMDGLEEPKSPADDEYDYDPRYGNKKRKKRRPGKRSSVLPPEGGIKKGRPAGSGVGRGRGRRKPRGETSGSGRQPRSHSPKITTPAEPPSFEMAAAAVEGAAAAGPSGTKPTDNDKNYQKYL